MPSKSNAARRATRSVKQSFRLLQHLDDAGQEFCSFNAIFNSMIIGEIKRNDRFGTEFNPVPDRLDRHSRDVQDRGFGRTELWEQLDKDLVAISKFEKEGESMDQFAENMILMKRYSYPDDVVGTAAFLASPESDYMTGQLIMINGGMVMQ